MGQLLLVEDSEEIQVLVQRTLHRHEITIVGNLADALAEISTSFFDLILLDLSLPDGDGLRFYLQNKNLVGEKKIPVVFLTSRTNADEIALAYDLGVEDYITKPIQPLEFRARIESKINKASQQKQESNMISLDNLVIDSSRYLAHLIDNGQRRQLELTPLEFKLLSFFSRHPEEVFTREQIIHQVWTETVNVSDRVVDSHMSNLRKKLKACSYTVVSVYSTGYSFRKLASRAA